MTENRFSVPSFTGRELLTGEAGDAETAAALRDCVLEHAAEARHNPTAFFEFVMREEQSKRPITIAPHQQVALDFALAHDRAILVQPVNTAKTFNSAGISLFLMGQDASLRGAVVSATETMAEKIVHLVSDYIRLSPELRMVFPHLQPSRRAGDKWTQRAITVDRPPGIRDPSLVALGYDSTTLPGSRLNWILCDDLVVPDNSDTPEKRDKLRRWFGGDLLTRLDPIGARLLFTNTPRHPKDLIAALRKEGWATLKMDIYGSIEVFDDEQRMKECKHCRARIASVRERCVTDDGKHEPNDPWDHPGLRPSTGKETDFSCRLAAHDPDPANEVPLWPERWPLQKIEDIRTGGGILPHEFNQMYLCIARDDAEAMCRQEWVDRCKDNARKRGIYRLVTEYVGRGATFMGVDLAFTEQASSDYTCLFIFEAMPSGHRRILWIEYMRADAPTVMRRIIELQRAYKCVVAIEDNGAQKAYVQMLRDIAAQDPNPDRRGVSFPVKGRRTGKNKVDPQIGVQSIFLDMYNAAWLIPNDEGGRCHPHVQRWIDECLDYTPTKHTGDGLMASWVAREQAREWGLISKRDDSRTNKPGIASTIMTR